MLKRSMPFVKLAEVSQVPEGSVLHVEVGDVSRKCDAVAICNVEGALHAMDGICPHAGGPLGEGALHGRILVCPYHGWAFDCVTGLNAEDDVLQQARYEVKVVNGEVLVNLP
jgi:nitrite reductase/ring-hydroxylating ferredoxin subunit